MTPDVPTALLAHQPYQRHRQFLDITRQALANADTPERLRERLEGALRDFLGRGRTAPTMGLQGEMAGGLPPRERALVEAARAAVARDLVQIPALQPGASAAAIERGESDIRLAAARAADPLLALRLGGEDEMLVGYVQGVLARLVEESAWACAVVRAAARRERPVADLAVPATVAALASRPIGGWGDTDTELKRSGLQKLSALPLRETRQAARDLAAELIRLDGVVAGIIDELSQQMRERLKLPVPPPEGRTVRFFPGARLPAEQEQDTPINLKTLVGFMAAGRGGSDAARVTGTTDLVRDIAAVSREFGGVVRGGWDTGTVQRTLDSLTRLAQRITEERQTHRRIEQAWRKIEDELRRQSGGGGKGRGEGGPPPVLPLPAIEALDARSLYYHNAVLSGLPVSIVLAELYDSDDLAFGPTERGWFERLAMYTARRYAGDLATDHTKIIAGLSTQPDRVAHVQGIVRGVEATLREQGHLDDESLRRRAKDALSALGGTELQRAEVQRLLQAGEHGAPDLIGEMILRLRAEQELRVITAHLAVHGTLTPEVVAEFRQLPHVQSFAGGDPEGKWFWQQRARNGQRLRELEQDTRARWARYRQEAPSYRDVRPVAIPGAEDEVAIHNPLGLRPTRPGTKPLPPVVAGDERGGKWGGGGRGGPGGPGRGGPGGPGRGFGGGR